MSELLPVPTGPQTPSRRARGSGRSRVGIRHGTASWWWRAWASAHSSIWGHRRRGYRRRVGQVGDRRSASAATSGRASAHPRRSSSAGSTRSELERRRRNGLHVVVRRPAAPATAAPRAQAAGQRAERRSRASGRRARQSAGGSASGQSRADQAAQRRGPAPARPRAAQRWGCAPPRRRRPRRESRRPASAWCRATTAVAGLDQGHACAAGSGGTPARPALVSPSAQRRLEAGGLGVARRPAAERRPAA